MTQNASEIHQKNETLVERAHEPEIREYEADVGQEQFRLFQQMQRVSDLEELPLALLQA